MQRLNIIASQIAQSPSFSKILIEKAEGIATLWLNSPKDLNCLSIAMGT
jgi:enoyl-CoA hydratase/carnithine racemase